MSERMRRVYCAGPVGKVEGRLERVLSAIEAGEQIAALGLAPFVPHFYHFWDSRHAHDYEFWMAHCMEWVRQCEALFRMPGASPGADREVELAKSLGLPVFVDMAELRRWARGETETLAAQPIAGIDVGKHNAEMAEYVIQLEEMSRERPLLLAAEVLALRGEVALVDEMSSGCRDRGENRSADNVVYGNYARDRLRLAERALTKLKEKI